jgi:hypothetical protein
MEVGSHKTGFFNTGRLSSTFFFFFFFFFLVLHLDLDQTLCYHISANYDGSLKDY